MSMQIRFLKRIKGPLQQDGIVEGRLAHVKRTRIAAAPTIWSVLTEPLPFRSIYLQVGSLAGQLKNFMQSG